MAPVIGFISVTFSSAWMRHRHHGVSLRENQCVDLVRAGQMRVPVLRRS
jgi:hypothetical protein